MSEDHLSKQIIGFWNTPPLWLNKQFGIEQFEFPEIDFTEFQAEAIPSKIRLGHQMEYVFKQLIDQCQDYEVLLHNLPIRQDKRTIGEIDFILRPTKGIGEKMPAAPLIHVELTYKFYIINPEISEPIHQLMGPNKRDMFFSKMEKIKNEQFQLLHSISGISALAEVAIDHSQVVHQTCYKAQLFKPYGSNSTTIRPLNKECIVGSWLRFDNFKIGEFKNYQYYIPYKSEWVNAAHNDVAWSSHYETLMDINLRLLNERAPMVWMRKSETEFEKFFVVWW